MASSSKEGLWPTAFQMILYFLLGLGLGLWIEGDRGLGISLMVCAWIFLMESYLFWSSSSATRLPRTSSSSATSRCASCCSLSSTCPLSKWCVGTSPACLGPQVGLPPHIYEVVFRKEPGPRPSPSSESKPKPPPCKP